MYEKPKPKEESKPKEEEIRPKDVNNYGSQPWELTFSDDEPRPKDPYTMLY